MKECSIKELREIFLSSTVIVLHNELHIERKLFEIPW